MKERVLRRLTSVPGMRSLWLGRPIGSVPLRVEYDVWDRPHYAYGTFQAAQQAKALGLKAISVIEFGVAGGKGLLALESTSKQIAQHFGIQISVYGFDAGEGMPEPSDYRDLPHVWAKGFYKMEQEKLRAALTTAKLVIGPVKQTVPAFLANGLDAPLGFVAFDLDYYTSTKDAFPILDAPQDLRLPRVFCYFDDIVWPESACHNEYVGELLAIREFNEMPGNKKLAPIHYLRHMRAHPAPWNDMIYVMHDFDHPKYNVNLTPAGTAHTQLPI